MPRSPATPPSQLDTHLGFWLRFVSNHVSAEFRRAVEANGVSVSEWVALRQLFDDEEDTAASLMATLGMTKGAVSKILTRLQDKGLVERVQRTDDGRAQLIVLTAAGRRLVPRLAAAADVNDERFFGHLPRAERKRLLALLQDLVARHGMREIPIE